jgi:hypothetical protein
MRFWPPLVLVIHAFAQDLTSSGFPLANASRGGTFLFSSYESRLSRDLPIGIAASPKNSPSLKIFEKNLIESELNIRKTVFNVKQKRQRVCCLP